MHWVACAFYTQSTEYQVVKIMLLYVTQVMFWEKGALEDLVSKVNMEVNIVYFCRPDISYLVPFIWCNLIQEKSAILACCFISLCCPKSGAPILVYVPSNTF